MRAQSKPVIQPNERLMTVGEVATYWHVNPKTVVNWSQQGRLKVAHRTLGGHRRFRESDVRALNIEPAEQHNIAERQRTVFADIDYYVYKQVADMIADRIRDGDLLPDERLLGERALAIRYDVAPSTIRRALKELRTRGLVITVPGKGTFVRSQDPR